MNLPLDSQLTCYTVGSHAVASVPCVFRKVEMGNTLSQKLEVGEWRFPAFYGTSTTDATLRNHIILSFVSL